MSSTFVITGPGTNPRSGFFTGVPYYGMSPSEGNMRSTLLALGNLYWYNIPAEDPDFVLAPRQFVAFNDDGTVVVPEDAYVAYKMANDAAWTPRNHAHVEYLYVRVLDEPQEPESGNYTSLVHAEVVAGNAEPAGTEIIVSPQAMFFERPGYAFVRIVKDAATFVDPATAFANDFVAYGNGGVGAM